MASVRRQRCTWAIAGYAAAATGALLVLALEASEAAAIAAAIGWAAAGPRLIGLRTMTTITDFFVHLPRVCPLRCSLALGLALQVLLVSPFITVVAEGIGSQAREDIRQALADKHDRFLPYFEGTPTNRACCGIQTMQQALLTHSAICHSLLSGCCRCGR